MGSGFEFSVSGSRASDVGNYVEGSRGFGFRASDLYGFKLSQISSHEPRAKATCCNEAQPRNSIAPWGFNIEVYNIRSVYTYIYIYLCMYIYI